MARPAGNIPRGNSNKKKPAEKPSIVFSVKERIEIEAFILNLWAEVDWIKQLGAAGFQDINIYATPVDENGKPIFLFDPNTGEKLKRVPINNTIKSTPEMMNELKGIFKGPS